MLDTHALLWWAHQPDSLSASARQLIADGDNEVFVSAVSAMEIATKARLGKLEFKSRLATDFVRQVESRGLRQVPVTADHGQLAGSYVQLHRDPWDRLLAAQSEIEDLVLITVDPALTAFGVHTFW